MTDFTFAVVGAFATSMHSSGMRTARLLTVSRGGGSLHPWGRVCPTPGGLHPGGSAQSQGLCIQGGLPNPGGGGEVSASLGGESASAANRMTQRRKNIILPQTSFVGGNYTHGTEWMSDPSLVHWALSEPVQS